SNHDYAKTTTTPAGRNPDKSKFDGRMPPEIPTVLIVSLGPGLPAKGRLYLMNQRFRM
ncbi:MAG: hypothetical protein ACI92S_004146, partial [Planctomycetaceae bacterium]